MKTNPYSAAGIRESESRANLKNKPVVNSSKNRAYDAEFDFIPLDERPEFKPKLDKARQLLIVASERALRRKKPHQAYISGVSLRRQIECTPDEWITILAKLMDEIDTTNVTIPHYRYAVRKVKRLPTRAEKNSEVFNRREKPKAEFPAEAIAERFR